MPGAYKLKLLISLLIIVVLQMCLSPYLALGDVRPDFFTAFVAGVCGYFSGHRCVSIAGVTGLIKDCFGVHAFGINFITLSFTALVLSAIVKKTDLTNPFMRVFFFFLFSFVSFSVYCTLLCVSENIVGLAGGFFIRVFPAAVYTGLFSIVIHNALNFLMPKKSAQYELF